jgi:hypothetical protein
LQLLLDDMTVRNRSVFLSMISSVVRSTSSIWHVKSGQVDARLRALSSRTCARVQGNYRKYLL